jgi:hypothetical protein
MRDTWEREMGGTWELHERYMGQGDGRYRGDTREVHGRYRGGTGEIHGKGR